MHVYIYIYIYTYAKSTICICIHIHIHILHEGRPVPDPQEVVGGIAALSAEVLLHEQVARTVDLEELEVVVVIGGPAHEIIEDLSASIPLVDSRSPIAVGRNCQKDMVAVNLEGFQTLHADFDGEGLVLLDIINIMAIITMKLITAIITLSLLSLLLLSSL